MENTENCNSDSDADSFIKTLLNLPHQTSNVSDAAVAHEQRRLEGLLGQEISERPALICPYCKRKFGLSQNLKRHVKLGTCRKKKTPNADTPIENRCLRCSKIFSSPRFLQRHVLSAHPDESTTSEPTTTTAPDRRQCNGCLRTFNSFGNMRRHLRDGSCKHVCCFCSQQIPGKDEMLSHVRHHMNNEYLKVSELKALRKQARFLEKSGAAAGRSKKLPKPSKSNPDSKSSSSDSEDSQPPNEDYQQERTTNFDKSLVKYRIRPSGAEQQDMMLLFSNKRQQFTDNIKTELKRFRGAKWYVCVTVKMTKYGTDGEIKDTAKPALRSVTQRVLKHDDIPSQIDAAYFKVCQSLERFKAEGSGWHLDEIELAEQTILKYNPLRGSCSSYSLPEYLRRKACLLSVTGTPCNSHECFKWTILAGMHVSSELTGEIHFSELQQHREKISFEGIECGGNRMSLSQIPEFEKLNKISVNIFGYENETFPLYISKNLDENTRKHVNLLLVSNAEEPGSDGHYCLIQSMSRLLAGERIKKNAKLYYCMRCLNPRYSAESLAAHDRVCSELKPVNCETVSEERKWLQFKNYHRLRDCPFVIVASFSCYSYKLYDKNVETEGRTVRERKLEPSAFAYFRISRYDSYPSEPVVYVGKDPEDTMSRFLKCMDEEQQFVSQVLSTVVPAKLCDIGVQNLMNSNLFCYSCSIPFDETVKPNRDHCHLTGRYLGNACNRCNLMLKESRVLPIFTHQMSKLDSRLILSAVGKYGYQNVKCLAQSCQNFISISINRCKYLDSKRFLNASLESLVESAMTETGLNAFKYLRKFVPSEHVELFTRKQIFCHDYYDGPDRLQETCLPPRSEFNDRFDEEVISDTDYEHVQRLWVAMKMSTMQDYLETYLLSEVLLLADVLSLFRGSMIDAFGLDPMHYYSISGYSFDCALRRTETKLELYTCLDMHQMTELSIRGGLALIGSPRYARANNPAMPEGEYDPQEEHSFIEMLDFNGLYNFIMANYKLPSFGFRWLSEREIERFDIMSIPESSDHGYICEVDLVCDPEVHDYLDSMPLCPENIRIKPGDLSEYTRKLVEQCGIGLEAMEDIKRLCLTLTDKTNYVCYHENLQFYLKHGMKLTKVHRVIRFTQTPWLEDFMKFVGEKRRESKSKFYQTMYKTIANNVYGKLLEQLRSHKNIKIATSPTRLHKLVSLPTFSSLHELGTDVAAVEMHKEKIVFNRPYAVGFCVLELAKLETYKLYYEVLLPAFSKGKIQMLMQDTDSYLIKISGYNAVTPIFKTLSSKFDFSNLPITHELRSDINRLKPGFVKLELGSAVCCEFCALSPKCYSLRTDAGFKQTVKGSRKRFAHELYKECLLEGKCHEVKSRDIRNYKDGLYQVSVLRRVLSPVDFKRYYLSSTESLSFGHYKIRQLQQKD